MLRLALVPLLLLVLGSTVGAQDRPAKKPPAQALGDATLAFGLDLHRLLAAEGGNVFFSPYSISAALSMAREGARGETAAQLDRVLRLPPAPAVAHQSLTPLLQPGSVEDWANGWDPDQEPELVPAYTLEVANALWVQEGFDCLRPFTSALEERYGAPLQRLDFAHSAAARARVNAWVAERTRDRIRDVVPEGSPSPDTRLMLANAIYFKAPWDEPFEAEATREQTFHTEGGEVRAPFMRTVSRMPYAEDTMAQVLTLPYRGDGCSLLVVLPRAKDGLAPLERDLTPARLASWLAKRRRVRVDVQLPRFETTYAVDLCDALARLGMPLPFDEQADFSGVTAAERLRIGAVFHKAFVAIDENGTEAAAATVVEMATLGLPQAEPDPIPFVADRPFLFAIVHELTGCVLFLGRIADPTAK